MSLLKGKPVRLFIFPGVTLSDQKKTPVVLSPVHSSANAYYDSHPYLTGV